MTPLGLLLFAYFCLGASSMAFGISFIKFLSRGDSSPMKMAMLWFIIGVCFTIIILGVTPIALPH